MNETVSVASVRWLITAVFVICLSATLLVAVQGRQNDDAIKAAIVKVDANTEDLKTAVHDLCLASNTAADSSNRVLQSLINAVTVTKTLPAAEKADRIRKYRAAMTPILKCPN